MNEQPWQKHFTPPFIGDTYNPGTIWDINGGLITSPSNSIENAADDDIMAIELAFNLIVDAMNAACEGREPDRQVRFENVEYVGTNDDAVVKFRVFGYDLDLEVRGWGYLTGYKKLPDAEAAAIQDSLGQFIAECIKNASKGDENAEQEEKPVQVRSQDSQAL